MSESKTIEDLMPVYERDSKIVLNILDVMVEVLVAKEVLTEEEVSALVGEAVRRWYGSSATS